MVFYHSPISDMQYGSVRTYNYITIYILAFHEEITPLIW